MRAAKNSLILPKEYLSDKPEDERKFRIRGGSFSERCKTLDEIFNFVARDQKHFITLDSAPHVDHYDPELLAVAEIPIEIKHVRERLYWSKRSLPGYMPGDKKKIEIRTEQKVGKHYYEQVLKLGGDSSKTLRRGEHKRALDGFGVNLQVYPDKIRNEAEEIVGGGIFKPLVHLQGQSKPLLYHPDGMPDVVFEIKFDKTVGKTFDNGFVERHAEVEIEIKEYPKRMDIKHLEVLFDQAEFQLLANFSDVIQPIFESKVSGLFRHVAGWKARDPKGFGRAFDALPGDRWAEYQLQ